MNSKLIVVLSILLVVLSCSLDVQPELKDIIQNGNIEEGEDNPAFWSFATVGLNEYEANWTSESYKSFNHSLKIEIDSIRDGGAFAYWRQILDTEIPYNKSLQLRLFVKLENVSFPGVNIAIRTDGTNKVLSFVNLKSEIRGTKDWAPYTLGLPYVHLGTKRIFVFLICHSKTTGTMYFDDISLTPYEF